MSDNDFYCCVGKSGVGSVDFCVKNFLLKCHWPGPINILLQDLIYIISNSTWLIFHKFNMMYIIIRMNHDNLSSIKCVTLCKPRA